MKFLHLSDLHIGKRLNEFSMLEDQKYILSQILEILDRENADGVILAGDIYDKPIPSVEAVQLFDSFLTRLADRKVPVFAVSGNHDSVERVSFGAQLMENRGVYISRVYDGTLKKIEMSDKNGEVCIWLLPFIKPSSVRHVLEEEEISTYQDALKTVMEHISVDTDKRAANGTICEMSGMVLSHSQLDTDCVDTPMWSATKDCDTPASLRSAFSRCPKLFIMFLRLSCIKTGACF